MLNLAVTKTELKTITEAVKALWDDAYTEEECTRLERLIAKLVKSKGGKNVATNSNSK
jgi:hypothetical protein